MSALRVASETAPLPSGLSAGRALSTRRRQAITTSCPRDERRRRVRAAAAVAAVAFRVSFRTEIAPAAKPENLTRLFSEGDRGQIVCSD